MQSSILVVVVIVVALFFGGQVQSVQGWQRQQQRLHHYQVVPPSVRVLCPPRRCPDDARHAIVPIRCHAHPATSRRLWATTAATAHNDVNDNVQDCDDCKESSNNASCIPNVDTKRRQLFKKTTACATMTGLVLAAQTSQTSAAVAVAEEAGLAVSSSTDSEVARIHVFERTAPSVVFIDTFTEQRDAFSTNVMEVPLGAGSGFVWDQDGHVVTNYHVVRNAKSAQVAILTKVIPVAQQAAPLLPPTVVMSDNIDDNDNKNNDNTPNPLTRMQRTTTALSSSSSVTDYTRSVYKAKVVGVDPGKDICVLKVDAPSSDLFPIEVGTSKGLRVGQNAMAIGNPFGLDHTLTVGVISGIGREVKSPTGRPISNVIQTDAAINPGNSGGPLLDASGRLIGMNTAIYSPSGGSAGIGFAIPVDTVKFIVETLIRDGKVIRPIIGISYLDSKQARALGIAKGVLVLEVPANSPAAKAGLKGTRRTETGLVEIGDVITKVENTAINTEADLFEALEDFNPGDTVKITVNRVVPAEDELRIREFVLSIPLQASSAIPVPYSFPSRTQQQ